MLRQIKHDGGNIVAMNTMPDSSWEMDQSQHERAMRLTRLSMLVECEGSITIGMTPPTKTRPRPALCPVIDVTNTAQAIIDEAKETLIEECIGFSVKPERKSAGEGRKNRFDINIHGFDRVEAALLVMLPYLRSKKPQAELLLEFIKSRRSSGSKSVYSDREWQITTEVRRMNGRQPNRKALAKAKAALEAANGPNRPRTIEYFRKYVEMCTELQGYLQ